MLLCLAKGDGEQAGESTPTDSCSKHTRVQSQGRPQTRSGSKPTADCGLPVLRSPRRPLARQLQPTTRAAGSEPPRPFSWPDETPPLSPTRPSTRQHRVSPEPGLVQHYRARASTARHAFLTFPKPGVAGSIPAGGTTFLPHRALPRRHAAPPRSRFAPLRRHLADHAERSFVHDWARKASFSPFVRACRRRAPAGATAPSRQKAGIETSEGPPELSQRCARLQRTCALLHPMDTSRTANDARRTANRTRLCRCVRR